MSVFVCRHCGKRVKNNGGSCNEVGMINVWTPDNERENFYCESCAKDIAIDLLDEVI
jgi:hypothetical protein